MMTSEAPVPSRANAIATGNEVSSPQADGQSTSPRSLDLRDTPASHIRNVRCILELAAEYSRNGLGIKDGTVILDREAVADIENKLGLALALLDQRPLTAAAAERPFSPFGDKAHEQLAFAVPSQSAPAFARKAGAR